MITIKKYPNRRLYDTSQSRYVNMDAVKALIRRDQEFVVQDSKTGDDITRQILMQIICEHEAQAHSTVLPGALLKQLIRQFGGSHPALLRKHLDLALGRFLAELDQQQVGEGEEDADHSVDGQVWPLSHGDAMPLEERRSFLAATGSLDISG